MIGFLDLRKQVLRALGQVDSLADDMLLISNSFLRGITAAHAVVAFFGLQGQLQWLLWKNWHVYWRSPQYNSVRLGFTIVIALVRRPSLSLPLYATTDRRSIHARPGYLSLHLLLVLPLIHISCRNTQHLYSGLTRVMIFCSTVLRSLLLGVSFQALSTL